MQRPYGSDLIISSPIFDPRLKQHGFKSKLSVTRSLTSSSIADEPDVCLEAEALVRQDVYGDLCRDVVVMLNCLLAGRKMITRTAVREMIDRLAESAAMPLRGLCPSVYGGLRPTTDEHVGAAFDEPEPANAVECDPKPESSGPPYGCDPPGLWVCFLPGTGAVFDTINGDYKDRPGPDYVWVQQVTETGCRP